MKKKILGVLAVATLLLGGAIVYDSVNYTNEELVRDFVEKHESIDDFDVLIFGYDEETSEIEYRVLSEEKSFGGYIYRNDIVK